jgi:hypothetical protein
MVKHYRESTLTEAYSYAKASRRKIPKAQASINIFDLGALAVDLPEIQPAADRHGAPVDHRKTSSGRGNRSVFPHQQAIVWALMGHDGFDIGPTLRTAREGLHFCNPSLIDGAQYKLGRHLIGLIALFPGLFCGLSTSDMWMNTDKLRYQRIF